jgi:hypothetical protein
MAAVAARMKSDFMALPPYVDEAEIGWHDEKAVAKMQQAQKSNA